MAWVTRAVPDYPADARALGLGPVECHARLFVRADGTLDHAEVLECPAVFRDAVTAAAAASLWASPPAADHGDVSFVLVYQFVADREGSAPPNLLNAAPAAAMSAEWCSADRVDLDLFAPVADAAWRRLPTLRLPPGADPGCAVQISLDPRGRPVHVAVRDAPKDWGYRVAVTWCGARAEPPGTPVTVTRPCVP